MASLVNALLATRPRFRDVHPLVRDLAVTSASSVITLVAGLLVISLFGRLLGGLLLGQYLLVRRVMTWLQAPTQMGLGVALPRYVARAMNGTKGEGEAYFVASISSSTVTAIILALVLNFRRAPLAGLLFGSSQMAPLVLPLTLLILGASFNSAVFGYYRGCLRMKLAGGVQVIGALVPLFAVTTLFRTRSVGVIVSVSGLLTIVSSCFFAIPIFYNVLQKGKLRIRRHAIELLQYGIPRVPGEFAAGALFAVGPIFAAHYVPLGQVSYLLLGTSILNAVAFGAGPLGLILLSKLSTMLAQQRAPEVGDHLRYLLPAVLEVSVFACLQIVIFADVLLRVWVGPGFLPGLAVIRIESFAIPFYLFYVTLRSAIDAASVKAYNARNFLISFVGFAGVAAVATKGPKGTMLEGIALGLVFALVVLAWLTARTVRQLYGVNVKWRNSGISILVAMLLGVAGLLFQWANGFRTTVSQLLIIELVMGTVFLTALLKTGSGWLPLMWKLATSSYTATGTPAEEVAYGSNAIWMDQPRMTPEARMFALQELSRRAGVDGKVFNSWKIHTNGDGLTLSLDGGSRKRVCFGVFPDRHWQQLCSGKFGSARLSWMLPPGSAVEGLVPDFVVPFVPATTPQRIPLFERVNSEVIKCNVDLLASIVLTLCRFEESTDSSRDEHGRYPASASLGLRDEFLDRPIVDEYGLAFEQILTALLPGWRPVTRKLRVFLTHDVDHISLPFSLRGLAHNFKGRPEIGLHDLFTRVWEAGPAYLDALERLVILARERGIRSAVYWKATILATGLDSGYDPRSPKAQRIIGRLYRQGVEQGIHPGYFTFQAPASLRREVDIAREALGAHAIGGRQHYLRWEPRTWLDWERLGLLYDSSVGYADRVGFRAGTCFPYRPWCLERNRRLSLIEVPLLVMDRTLLDYMELSAEQAIKATQDCVSRCQLVGGVFTLLWHNSTILRPEHRKLYESVLDLIAGNESYRCDQQDGVMTLASDAYVGY